MRYFKVVKNATDIPKLPERSTEKSAGYDFFAPTDLVLPVGLSDTIWLNVKVKLNHNEFLEIKNRSSMMSKHNVMLFCSGIIDADYFGNESNDGNIGIRFFNWGPDKVTIEKGNKLCQGIILRYYKAGTDKAKGKRCGGFGSTGV